MTDATRKKIIKWFWILFCVPVALVVTLICLVWAFADIPSFEELENPDSKLATQVIAEDGEILTTFHIEHPFKVGILYQILIFFANLMCILLMKEGLYEY